MSQSLTNDGLAEKSWKAERQLLMLEHPLFPTNWEAWRKKWTTLLKWQLELGRRDHHPQDGFHGRLICKGWVAMRIPDGGNEILLVVAMAAETPVPTKFAQGRRITLEEWTIMRGLDDPRDYLNVKAVFPKARFE